MAQSQRFKSLVVVVVVIAVGLAGIYGLSRSFGIVWGFLLALASLPMSLLIPVASIRYGILGAWFGAFVGWLGCGFIVQLTGGWIGTWVLLVLFGGCVIAGASIGAAIAFRKNS